MLYIWQSEGQKNNKGAISSACSQRDGCKNKHNRKSIERIDSSYEITDKSEVKEDTEVAIVLKASISLSLLTVEEKYWSIVELYESQVNISHRTSHSILQDAKISFKGFEKKFDFIPIRVSRERTLIPHTKPTFYFPNSHCYTNCVICSVHFKRLKFSSLPVTNGCCFEGANV